MTCLHLRAPGPRTAKLARMSLPPLTLILLSTLGPFDHAARAATRTSPTATKATATKTTTTNAPTTTSAGAGARARARARPPLRPTCDEEQRKRPPILVNGTIWQCRKVGKSYEYQVVKVLPTGNVPSVPAAARLPVPRPSNRPTQRGSVTAPSGAPVMPVPGQTTAGATMANATTIRPAATVAKASTNNINK